MASGKRHAKSTKRNLFWLLPSSIFLAFVEPSAIGLGLGSIIGHLITPDIDHHKFTYEENRIYRLNKLLGALWWLFWWPYEKIFAHRGISHWKVIGTLTRFLYLLWYPLFYNSAIWTDTASWLFWLWLFLGWTVQDFAHLRLDRKKKKRKKLKPHRRYIRRRIGYA